MIHSKLSTKPPSHTNLLSLKWSPTSQRDDASTGTSSASRHDMSRETTTPLPISSPELHPLGNLRHQEPFWSSSTNHQPGSPTRTPRVGKRPRHRKKRNPHKMPCETRMAVKSCLPYSHGNHPGSTRSFLMMMSKPNDLLDKQNDMSSSMTHHKGANGVLLKGIIKEKAMISSLQSTRVTAGVIWPHTRWSEKPFCKIIIGCQPSRMSLLVKHCYVCQFHTKASSIQS